MDVGACPLSVPRFDLSGTNLLEAFVFECWKHHFQPFVLTFGSRTIVRRSSRPTCSRKASEPKNDERN